MKTTFDIFICYLMSATHLHGQSIEASNGKVVTSDVAAYYAITALYLYRHTLELGIKALLEKETGKKFTVHNIKSLWEKLPNYQDRSTVEISEAFAVLGKYHILEDAQLFRYEVDKKGTQLQDVLPIEEKTFKILGDAAWAVYREICEYAQMKSGLPFR
jgi:hypothetical protein